MIMGNHDRDLCGRALIYTAWSPEANIVFDSESVDNLKLDGHYPTSTTLHQTSTIPTVKRSVFLKRVTCVSGTSEVSDTQGACSEKFTTRPSVTC